MERALNLDLLRAALGEEGMFPSPEELQRRLAETEIALFIQRGAVDDDLLATAWFATRAIVSGPPTSCCLEPLGTTGSAQMTIL